MNFIIIGLFFTIMLAVGIISMKNIHTMAGYAVADRGAGAVVMTGSLLATVVGGSSTIGLAGLGYSLGLVGAWWLLVGAVGLAVLGTVFARRVRETGAYTLPEILERQYGGSAARLAASGLIVVAWLGIIAAQMIAAGKILAVLWPGQTEILTVTAALVFIVYTALGGQYSIIRTDAVQAVIVAAGIIFCLVFGIDAVGGGARLLQALPEGSLSFPLSSRFGWNDLVTFLFFVGAAYLVGPDIYSRILSVRDADAARRALLVTAACLVVIAFAVVFIGMTARVLLPDIQPESALPALVMNVVPRGLSGLVVVALLAAIMSSADSCLLTAGTVITSDIIGSLRGERPGEGSMLLLTRVAVVFVGLVSLVVALELGGIIASLLLAYTVYSAGIVIPVVFGFYRARLRLNSRGAIASIVIGGALGGSLKFVGCDEYLPVVLVVSVALLFGVSYVSRYCFSEKEA